MLCKKLMAVNPEPVATTITYNAGYAITLTGTTYTGTNISLGAPAPGRIVAVYVGGGFNSSSRIASVTIAGVAATKAVDYNINSARHGSIWYAVIDTGSTGSVVLTYGSQTSVSSFISTASIYNALSTTPITNFTYGTGTGVSSSRTISITCSAGSVFFGGYNAGSVLSGSVATWTNALERTDVMVGTVLYTDATNQGLPAGARSFSISASDNTVNNPGLVGATWA